MFPPSLSHNAEMGRLSLTGTHMTTGTLDEALACACSRMGCFFSAGLQRGHVEVHSMFFFNPDHRLLHTSHCDGTVSCTKLRKNLNLEKEVCNHLTEACGVFDWKTAASSSS